MQTAATFGRRVPAQPIARSTPQPRAEAVQAAVIQPKAEPVTQGFTVPWVTLGLAAVLIALYLIEATLSAAAGHPAHPSHGVLLKLGGVSGNLVFHQGQVWRILTASLLHASVAHLVGNLVALVLVGLLLEPIVGWRWFGALYAIGGLGGAVGSLMMNSGGVISVGASGAIMGVLASALTLSFHVACYDQRKRIRFLCLRVGVPALLPFGGTAGHVDYSAHMGGVIAGIIAAWVLLMLWNEQEDKPPFAATAGLFAGGMAVISLAIFTAAAALPTSAVETVTAGLMPTDDIPDTLQERLRRSAELASLYPSDPRALTFAALQALKAGDDAAAEVELNKALASPLIDAPEIPANTAQMLRATLVSLYLKDGAMEDARTAAAPFCAAPQLAGAKVTMMVRAKRLCEPAA